MDADKSFLTVVREIVSVVKTGGGILGKSAVLIGLIVICGVVAIFRLHDDQSILYALGLIALIFFLWYGPILWLVNKFPEKAFLDGSQWAEHHRETLLASKGQPFISAGSGIQVTPGEAMTSNPAHNSEEKPA